VLQLIHRLQQTSFRIRFDNGDETTATWYAATNTNAPAIKGFIIFRARFLISQTVSNANRNLARAFKLRYSYDGGAYTDVGAQTSTNTPIRMADSSNVADNDATTQQIGSGTFITGSVEENNDTGTITFTSGALSSTELEFVLAINGNQFDTTKSLLLQVYETNNTALSAYTNTPTILRARRVSILG
jgi:hypothetical protein